MNTLAALANSSIGKKWIVAITGLTLVGFVIVHMLGNLQILWPVARDRSTSTLMPNTSTTSGRCCGWRASS